MTSIVSGASSNFVLLRRAWPPQRRQTLPHFVPGLTAVDFGRALRQEPLAPVSL